MLCFPYYCAIIQSTKQHKSEYQQQNIIYMNIQYILNKINIVCRVVLISVAITMQYGGLCVFVLCTDTGEITVQQQNTNEETSFKIHTEQFCGSKK